MKKSTMLPRIRVYRGDEVAFGPGKADLLTHLAETASLRQAAKRMGMSYMRAWRLVQIMNASFKKPLVRAERGGSGGGGAELTEYGREVLRLYREMEAASLSAMSEGWNTLRRMLAKTGD